MDKQALVSTLESMPDQVSAEDVIEKVLFLQSLERGLAEADRGELLSENDLKSRLGKWLS
jgi:predicted transcriptional regulator